MDGKGRYGTVRDVMFGAVILVAAVGLYRLLPSLTVPYRPDIHSEYVKFLSGKDTITAYLAYPERSQPAPAVVVIHEIFGMSDFVRRQPNSSRRTASSRDRKSTRLNSSHGYISYAVFCLKKKKKIT